MTKVKHTSKNIKAYAAGNVASSCTLGVETTCKTGTPAASDTDCDNVDDDCNGSADEDYVPVTDCGIGACAKTGTTSCVSGAITDSCTPGTPAASDADCDNVDDDCSGAKDEDYVANSSCFLPGACAALYCRTRFNKLAR